MPTLRLLLLFALCCVAYFVVKSFIAGKKREAENNAKLGDPMVLDPQCQTYVPRADAIERGGKFFCSEECARRYSAG
jgi:hypothetical protein